MDIHFPNAFLDRFHSWDHRMKVVNDPALQKIVENQLKTAPFRQDPTVGTYQMLTWEGGFDLSKEIMVIPDGYIPGKEALFHSHDFFEIIYVYSGHCQTQLSGKPTELCSGDICLYNLYAVHEVRFSKPEDGIFNIIIRKELFRRLLLELLAESDTVSSFFLHILYDQESLDSCIYLKPEDGYLCEQMAQRIVEDFFRERPMSQNALRAQMTLFLIEIARQYRDDHIRESQRSRGDIDIGAVITYISNHYQTTSLEDVAGHFGYSTRSMTRFLQKYTGYGFRKIIQDVRFSHARSMLQETCLSIDEIAATVGYKDRSNFENAFKKYCHITPSAFRKKFFLK